ncbi:AMP-binding protein [Pseudohalioglobus sediminis]|uniref:AMP-binding protein n=1 Tax=Pseudohalioglobus sediminis TaxID=2606449 RepID=A0A5B0X134_9GAMM|nr:AMP-binding protein [Pseudohalioglobus sediminis]KAA1192365.1 AMP-binding protein [Pseudohalioglobus sediminis]
MRTKSVNIGFIPAKTARLEPAREALIDVHSGRRMTFGELDERVRRLGNALVDQLALDKGDRVAILSKNSIEYMEILYACARVGMIAQPINWRLGAEEMARVVADGAPALVISSGEYAEQAAQLKQRVEASHWLSFGPGGDDSYDSLVAASASHEPALSSSVGNDDPTLILYTGGTTGESKGALHTHRTLFMGMLNQTVAERVVPSDVYMLTGQMFHIPVALGMNYHAHGCPMVLINFDARLALETIERERVSAFLGITTMLNWMMADEKFDSFDLSSLRNIQYGGGPMPHSVVARALEAFPCTIIQGYGQTEGMTMSFLSQEDHIRALAGEHPERLGSCGREGFITEIRLADTDGNTVPRDGKTPGEILVRSEANMVGYWQRPELTAQTLRDGWMWTGDIAVWDEDGYIFIVDRAKDMIISGGENIFSTQVEAAIHQHPGVLESAVFGIPDDEWGESVKAVVVMKPGETATEQEIIDTAARHLASYQKPKSVDFVDSLPKAPTGKILKRQLRDVYWQKAGKHI